LGLDKSYDISFAFLCGCILIQKFLLLNTASTSKYGQLSKEYSFPVVGSKNIVFSTSLLPLLNNIQQ